LIKSFGGGLRQPIFRQLFATLLPRLKSSRFFEAEKNGRLFLGVLE